MRRHAITALFLLPLLAVPAAADPVVEIDSRGHKIRAVLLTPDNPRGSVILFAGNNGRLDISADGTIAKLAGNQLVRTRARYAAAGYATLVPDIAPDFKLGADSVKDNYRTSAAHARDVGVMVSYLRGITPKPVVAIGTSRGSVSVANAVAKLKATPALRPDATVLTSALLRMGSDVRGTSVWRAADGNARLLDVPMLVVWHVADTCFQTLPSGVGPFRTWYRRSGRTFAEKSFSGGEPAQSDPCEARSPHGFLGLDSEVVQAITAWISGL